MKLSLYCNKIITYSFYLLFFLVPLVFWGSTSELFELNKMFFTYGITLIIFTAWLGKAIIEKKIYFKRTPLDLPLLLFLISQVISTIISLDTHVSFWGYYSRFNGGLLSTICYVFLYYALITHLEKKDVTKLLKITLISGLIVILWGLPSHFGYDPTCYVFRREFNVACWTEAFKPTIRMFSTLGQPAWMAAYLATLLPISMALFLNVILSKRSKSKDPLQGRTDLNGILHFAQNDKLKLTYYFLLTTLFYISLLYTNTRAGFLGFWIANGVFWVLILIKRFFSLKQFLSLFVIFNFSFLIFNFFNGTPIDKLNIFTLNSIKQNLPSSATHDTSTLSQTQNSNITNSADIRRIVWKGAIDAWKAYPLFGSGVETFAFAYYKYRPVEHNLTSEWDYLYNKAHNEYLNYLTTTGITGLGSYLLLIGVFSFQVIKLLHKNRNKLLNDDNTKTLLVIKKEKNLNTEDNNLKTQLLTIGLFAGWISILITNFFGFSVVIINLFLLLIPAFIFILNNKEESAELPISKKTNSFFHISVSQYLAIIFLLLASGVLLLALFRYWQADAAYSLGMNLSRNSYPQEAYISLKEAVSIRPNEPVFKDELSIATLQLSLTLFQQSEATLAAQLAQQAVELNNEVLTAHPNYLPFWKTRIRLFYALSELESSYTNIALEAAEKSAELAPTDAKIWYNLGVLYGQVGYEKKGEETLLKTIKMKPDYQDAYLALGLLYRQMATDENESVIDVDLKKKADEILNNLLNKYPDNQQAKNTLEEWRKKDAN